MVNHLGLHLVVGSNWPCLTPHSSDKDGGREVCQAEGSVPEAKDRPHTAAERERGDPEEVQGPGCSDGTEGGQHQGRLRILL